jgi:hypothetical protein
MQVITSDSHNTMYPELPSFADHLIEENDSGVQSSAYAYNSYSAEQNEETASLLPRQSNAAVPISSGAHMYSNPLVGTREEAPELVTDLVRENSRLADEVANLKRILQDQQVSHRCYVLFCLFRGIAVSKCIGYGCAPSFDVTQVELTSGETIPLLCRFTDL